MRQLKNQDVIIVFNDNTHKHLLCRAYDNDASIDEILKKNKELKELTKIHGGGYRRKYKCLQLERVLDYYKKGPIIDKSLKICKWEKENNFIVQKLCKLTNYNIIGK